MILVLFSSIVFFIASICLIITGMKMDDTGYLDISPILIAFGIIWLIVSILLFIVWGCEVFL